MGQIFLIRETLPVEPFFDSDVANADFPLDFCCCSAFAREANSCEGYFQALGEHDTLPGMKNSLPLNPAQQAAQAAGNAATLAKTLGLSHVAVGKWVRTGRIPAERVLAVERATGVSRYRLRPDIYPLEMRV